jgi:outer membrane protein assembly factor BamB
MDDRESVRVRSRVFPSSGKLLSIREVEVLMTRSSIVLVLLAPMLGCARPDVEKKESPDVAPAVDRRPAVGSRTTGDDITAVSREQNREGNEPGLPSDRGRLNRTRRIPVVHNTSTGFEARLPGARDVPTPAYYRGRIYTGGMGTHEFHAMNAETGETAWSLRMSDDGATAPACQDGVCTFNTYSCTIFTVDADTGKHLWSWYLGSPQLATPVIAGNVVYTSYPDRSGPVPYVLAAFELKTGEPLWRRWIDAEVNSTPVVFRGSVYVASQKGTLYQFKADGGDVVSVRRNRIASAPVVTLDAVTFGRDAINRDNQLIASSHVVLGELELSIDPQAPRVEPKPRPLIVRHRMVTVDDGVVTAIDRKTGRQLWESHLPQASAARVSAPLLYAGDSILLATSAGNVLRIKPATGDITERFSLGGGTLASQPIAVDGWIYAGTTKGSVIGYDTGHRELTGWEMLGGGPERRGTVEPEDS